MLRALAICMVWLLLSHNVQACDVCGCSLTSQTLGVLPKFNKHFVGIRYGFSSFRSEHPAETIYDKPVTSRELFSTVDIWSRWNIGKKSQIFVFVPFSFIQKNEEGVKQNNQGLGDMSILFMYSFLQKENTKKESSQLLQAGGGIKFPTGNNNFIQDDEWIPAIQTGTATWDYFVNINYITRWKQWSLQGESSFRINQNNEKKDFRNGNRFQSAARFMYTIKYKNMTCLPVAGLVSEWSNRDFHEGAYNDFSGGHSLSGQIGTELWFNKFGLGMQVFIPFYQTLGAGQITAGPRFTTHLSYFF
ncbi:MAG: hypothetical protein IPN79_05850 [Saprospiraceae bacterium]|nr:hypothetical protein [Saprospiraceae bacterium]